MRTITVISYVSCQDSYHAVLNESVQMNYLYCYQDNVPKKNDFTNTYRRIILKSQL